MSQQISLVGRPAGRPAPLVDVVVVSYNSAAHLRASVTPLAEVDDVNVIVVDNCSTDGTLETVGGLPITTIASERNGGFAAGCNIGWRAGGAPYVLFLNPDASIDERSLRELVSVLERDGSAGAAAPRIEYPDGSLAYSQRRFPSLVRTYSQAFFLHRIFRQANWSDEVIRDEAAYGEPRTPDWVSGACILIRRPALVELDGWDERYFLYCEDLDICKRLRSMGMATRFVPSALAVHVAGQSAPATEAIPLLAASKVRYGKSNRGSFAAAAEHLGIALGTLTRVLFARGGLPYRRAYVRAFRTIVSRKW